MSRPALFSYEGALRVLGKYDRPWLDKADTFLGVGILVDGAVEPGFFSLVDPKNEATACLRKILNGITDKLTGLSGKHRHELIAAAHTIIVVTSVFEAFGEEIGENFDKLAISDSETFRILYAEPPENRKEVSALPSLTSLTVPLPSATRGFHENFQGPLLQFLTKAIFDVQKFLRKLIGQPTLVQTIGFSNSVFRRISRIYHHHYFGIAAAIPEFQIWALLGGHAATRAKIKENNAGLALGLAAVRTESLERFSQLMAQISGGRVAPGQRYRKRLRNVAEAVLHRPIIGSNIDPSSVEAVFPTVEEGFIAPGYRLAVYDGATVASSREWWTERTVARDDLDTFLAAHLAGVESTERPLLILGNPGAGKSLLIDVLAARLPASQFTVVTVQLRKVRTEDRLQNQIESALLPVLGKGVDWHELADSCENSLPVVLLDGFDELIQASGVHQSTYLQQVQEFQQHQADLGRPVAVLVTSRMLVADRARIPYGTPIVKLEEFDDDRIKRWLDTWTTANHAAPDFRPITMESLDQHLELARQPLLLLMLAIYAADPSQAPLNDPSLSNAELYRRLIDQFVVRQVSQTNSESLAPDIVRKLTVQNSWRLGIAAFAMFNRGHQYVTAPQLNQDLAIFAPTRPARPSATFDTPIDDADRTVENFFFIHSPTLNEGALRTYEFLHATFGEYLIAEVTMKLLVQMAATRAVLTAKPFGEVVVPDDSGLFALTSHQAFVKRRPIIEFAQGLFSALRTAEQESVLAILDDLIQSFHDTALLNPHAAYRPTNATVVSRIANYSANLVTLRVLLDPDWEAPLEGPLTRGDTTPLTAWRSTVTLWKSGLDPEGWRELLDVITLTTDATRVIPQHDNHIASVLEARLLGDPVTEGMLRAGQPFVAPDTTSDPHEQTLLADLSEWLSNASGPGSTGRAFPYDIDAVGGVLNELSLGVSMNRRARGVLAAALAREASRLPRRIVEHGLELLSPRTPSDCQSGRPHPIDLISMVCAHPDLIGRGAFPTYLLPDIFKATGYAALPSLALVWTALNSGDSRVDDAFRSFAEVLEKASAPHLDELHSGYFPVDAFEYLAEARATEPTINGNLLGSLSDVVDSAADLISPQVIVKLLKRFQPHASEAHCSHFASAYLSGRTVDDTAEDEEALDFLRQLAGEDD